MQMVKIMLDNKPFISFGPFQLFPIERRLQKDGKNVGIGSRALDILIALVERPGELISKNELTTRAWPNVFVEECNLKVQVAALRRALDDKSDRERDIVNIPGRGYRFIASIKTSEEMKPRAPQQKAHRTSNLPIRPTRLIGRTSVVSKLAMQLAHQSFVTIVGPGGVGKR